MTRIEGKPIWRAADIPDRDDCRVELTDLVRFQDHWYCGFREGAIHHAHPSGRARIIRSLDGEEWETAALFDWELGDVRAPRLCVTAEGALMGYTCVYFVSAKPRNADGSFIPEAHTPSDAELPSGSFYQLESPKTPPDDLEEHVARQSLTWLSKDGVTWSSAHACPTGVNMFRWSAVWHDGMGYALGKERGGILYRTRDGRRWRLLKDHFGPDGVCNEGSIAFDEDGTAYCLLRDGRLRSKRPEGVGGTSVPLFGVGEPPYYQNWTWSDVRFDYGSEHGGPTLAEDALRAPLGGPKFIRLTDGRFVAAARTLGPDQDDGRICLFWVDPGTATLTRFAEMDGTSYAGIAEEDGVLWVTFRDAVANEILLTKIDLDDHPIPENER